MRVAINSALVANKRISSKCMEEVSKLCNELGIEPMFHLPEIIAELEKKYDGGVSCRLFPKNQHAGIREIYVLPLKCRILQLFVEVCARNFNKLIPEETLSNPENKTRLIDEFHKTISNTAAQISQKIGAPVDIILRYSPEDKTRWNQRFDPRIFNLAALKLFPPNFAKSISRILSMWKEKIVFLQPDLQDALFQEEDVYDDETYHKLHDAFKGIYATPEWKILMGDGKVHWSYIKVVMGMCQGILHSMSSTIHVLQSINLCSKHIFHLSLRDEVQYLQI